MKARQNKLVADKSTFIEFEVFGTWAWDHDCEFPIPDTHWIEYEEICEQLGVEEAKEAAQTFLNEAVEALTDRTHEIEDVLAGAETPAAPVTG